MLNHELAKANAEANAELRPSGGDILAGPDGSLVVVAKTVTFCFW